MNQTTIKNPIEIKGVGLHTGRSCHAKFLPAPANTGVVFVRTDLPGRPSFPAQLDQVVDVIRGTTLGSGEARVYTIEHILSALNGMGIDNLQIELDDNEPPVADGSAMAFVTALKKAGSVEQPAERRYCVVKDPYEYISNQTSIRVEPADHFEIDCEIGYNHPLITSQRFVYSERDSYESLIAPSRTYCFDYEIEALKKQGLAKGGSLDNAIVIGPAGIYNPESSLRFPDEFVRHKVLDLMGDLFLLGARLKGRVVAKRCGHGHNIKFLRQFVSEQPSLRPLPV